MKTFKVFIFLMPAVLAVSDVKPQAQTPPIAWAERVAGTVSTDDELVINFAMDGSANSYATGWFDGTNDFGGIVLTKQSQSDDGQDIFVAKYNSNGALQWAGAQVQSAGTVQIWPGTPVPHAQVKNGNEGLERGQPCPRVTTPSVETPGQGCPCSKVIGIRLLGRGVGKKRNPSDGFASGMDIHTALTIVGNEPIGPVGRQLDEQSRIPDGYHTRDRSVDMKFIMDLPEKTPLKAGAGGQHSAEI